MGMLQLLPVLVLMIILVEAQTTFDYPPFLLNDTNLLMGGDTKLNEDAYFGNSDVTLNTGSGVSFGSPGTCASLLYGKPLQMRGKSSSFTTAFTFSMTGTPSAGFAFVLLPQNRTTGIPGGKLCLMPRNLDATNSQFLAVEFDTFKNPEFNDPSNNHVGVNINSMNSSVTYNLCGDGIGECTYLVYDMVTSLTIVHDFTSWIEYDSMKKNLAVFLANGSTLQDIPKPTSAVISFSVDLSDVMTDSMFVGFTGSTNSYDVESKKITSWSFSTSARLTEAPPPLGPINNGTSPPLAPINNGTSPGINGPPPRAPGSSPDNIVPASSTGDSGSKSAKIVGTTFGIIGAVVLLVMFYWVKKLLRLPLHFFISLTGGNNQEYRNFTKSLYRKLTKSWTLKCFIKVFMDSERLRTGRPYIPRLKLELEKMEVGIVVVTPEYFTKKWPMTELISFIKSQDKNRDVIILPLFYEMTVEYVREILEIAKLLQVSPERAKMELGQAWNKAWNKRTRREEASIPFEDCQHAVQKLCGFKGIEYKFRDRCYDEEYIDQIVKEVGKIVREVIWKRVKDVASFNKNASQMQSSS